MDTPSDNIESARISLLSGEYFIWFAQIMRASLYPDQTGAIVATPPLLDEIPEVAGKLENEALLAHLVGAQANLHQIAENFVGIAGTSSPADFDLLWNTYESFATRLQRLERDFLLADFGVDVSTGLRTSVVMIAELEKELERRSRRGQPFAVAVLRIDDPALRSDELVVRRTAEAVAKTIRSFDDAYVAGGGEFVISLKHSDSNGGLRFVARFNAALRENPDVHHTVSACVAEPLPGDDMATLLANVRADLDHISGGERGSAGQYEEISPLNRFLQGLSEQDQAQEQETK